MPHRTAARPKSYRSLDQMANNRSAAVVGLLAPTGFDQDSTITRRLGELGFLPGETVTVLRRGPGGRDPIAVQIGETVFALRSLEASCIQVDDDIVMAHS